MVESITCSWLYKNRQPRMKKERFNPISPCGWRWEPGQSSRGAISDHGEWLWRPPSCLNRPIHVVQHGIRRKRMKRRITRLITTSEFALTSATLSKSDRDATTVLTPRVFNSFALSAFRTSAIISNVSLLGWASIRWRTVPPIYPDIPGFPKSLSDLTRLGKIQ